MLVSLVCAWERMKDEGEVDVAEAVTKVKLVRPQVVASLVRFGGFLGFGCFFGGLGAFSFGFMGVFSGFWVVFNGFWVVFQWFLGGFQWFLGGFLVVFGELLLADSGRFSRFFDIFWRV